MFKIVLLLVPRNPERLAVCFLSPAAIAVLVALCVCAALNLAACISPCVLRQDPVPKGIISIGEPPDWAVKHGVPLGSKDQVSPERPAETLSYSTQITRVGGRL